MQVPAVLLGMLGVDKRFQGKGLDSVLLADAIGAKALVVAAATGCPAT